MKKIWLVLSFLSALITGMLLYEGAVLFFRYMDRKMGLLVAASGAAVAVLFVFCIFESFNTGTWKIGNTGNRDFTDADGERVITQKKVCTEFILTCIAFGCAGAGILFYSLRFRMIFIEYLYILVFAACVIAVAAVGILSLTGLKIKESSFRREILGQSPEWEKNGWTSENGISAELIRIHMEAKTAALQVWGGGAALVFSFLFAKIGNGSYSGLPACLAVYIVIYLIVLTTAVIKCSGQIIRVLESGEAEAVLGFFSGYYKQAEGRVFSLPVEIQYYAVSALCALDAYEEALALLESVRRKPRQEAFYQQYVWFIKWQCADREGSRRALESLEASLHYLKGKAYQRMRQEADLFRKFQEGRYSEAVKMAQQGNVSAFQRRNRQKIIETALREQQKSYNVPEINESNGDGENG